MSGTPSDPRYKRRPPKRPLRFSWSDERVRGIFWQIVVVAAVGSLIYWLYSNTSHNLAVRRIATGFGFLDREAKYRHSSHQQKSLKKGKADYYFGA
jgi:general L-amino acid transport system permease protein